MKTHLKSLASASLLSASLMMASSVASAVDFGKPGEPIDLVVGYQPYYTESWSGVVNNGMEFWKAQRSSSKSAFKVR